MSSFDTARDIRLPGLVIERVYIDPSKLTTRMKNSIKAMIRGGVLKGGWNSKAKQLAQKLTDGSDVMVLSTNGRGFYAPSRRSYNAAVAEEVCTLIDADEALELMADSQTYGNHHHIEVIMERTRNRHKDAKIVVNTTAPHRWCYMHSTELVEEIAKLFATTRSAKQIEAAEKLCDMLDNNTPMPITLSK